VSSEAQVLPHEEREASPHRRKRNLPCLCGSQVPQSQGAGPRGSHGDFILVENAVYRPNERFSVPLEGTLSCSYPHEGEVYHFQSRIQTDLGNGLAFLEYPLQFQVEKIRKHHRILVDIETRFYLQGTEEPMEATMTDISEGGCCLVVAALFPAVRHTVCEIELTLPDDQQIVGLKARVQKIGFPP